MHEQSRDDSNIADAAEGHARLWQISALVIASVMLAGSLYVSIVAGLKACPLCLYQRTFAMAVVGVLAMGLLSANRQTTFAALASVPLALGGLGVAIFHVYLELAGTLECPSGLFGWGTVPQQSLGLFVLLVAALSAALAKGRTIQPVGRLPLTAAILLGALFFVGAIRSAPPLPPPPTQPYQPPLEKCRPPFQP